MWTLQEAGCMLDPSSLPNQTATCCKKVLEQGEQGKEQAQPMGGGKFLSSRV
jgi:hypothetical protein